MKIVFMGTPDFAVGSLEALYEAGHEVVLVVTQPDREKGRGKAVQMTPVKECALSHGTPVFQPVKIRTPESVAELKKYPADVFVVAAFGQILTREIIDMSRFGCVNVHASLLPKYRGAAPIQWSIIDGEKETGVTIMQIDEGLDTGDMISRVVVPITDEETGESLHDKLSAAGAKLLIETLLAIENGTAVRTPQPKEGSTYAKMLTRELGNLDFTMDVRALDRLIRALTPWPSAYTRLNGKVLKLWSCEVIPGAAAGAGAGTITEVTKDYFDIAAGSGVLRVRELQIEGKKRMTAGDFLRGYKVEKGTVLPC